MSSIFCDQGSDPAKRRLIALNLFALMLATYLVTASGYTLIDAGQLRVEVARSIVENGDVSVPAGLGMLGRDGRYYSWFGIGPVLAALPIYVASKLADVPPVFAISLLDQVASAVTVTTVFLFCTRVGFSNRSSLLASLFYGVGTIAWPYAKHPTDHALETLFVLLAVYFMYRHRREQTVSTLVLSALSLGYALLVRPTSILAAPTLAILLTFPLPAPRPRYVLFKNHLLYSICLLPFITLILGYNYVRFGSIFETGHRLIATRIGIDYFTGTPIITGLTGFLLSPGKGFFYFSPVALLFFIALPLFKKKSNVLSLAFVVLLLSFLLFYAKNIFWHGSTGWGPRYLIVITPYFLIPVAAIFDSATWREVPFLRSTVYCLFVISFIIQAGAVAVSPYKYFVYLQTEKNVTFRTNEGPGVQPILEPPAAAYFDWRLSPILAQFKFAGEFLAHMEQYRFVPPPEEASLKEKVLAQPWMNVFDFWWLYALFEGRQAGLAVALLLVVVTAINEKRILNLLSN